MEKSKHNQKKNVGSVTGRPRKTSKDADRERGKHAGDSPGTLRGQVADVGKARSGERAGWGRPGAMLESFGAVLRPSMQGVEHLRREKVSVKCPVTEAFITENGTYAAKYGALVSLLILLDDMAQNCGVAQPRVDDADYCNQVCLEITMASANAAVRAQPGCNEICETG